MLLCEPNLVKMARDLKIEIFAYYQFYDSWLLLGKKNVGINVLQVYGDECTRYNDYLEVCDGTFVMAIYCRMVLFAGAYVNISDYEEALRWKSLSDFHDYVNRLCDRNDLFGHLTICEKMFATCAFVRYLCHLIYEKSLIDVVNYGHIIWAMYFDKFTDKFYQAGGWQELKRVAETYIPVYNLLTLFQIPQNTKQYPRELKEATVNYCNFKNAASYYCCKYKFLDRIHISNLWIILRSNFKEYITIPSSNGNYDDSFEIELLLLHLKRVCNYQKKDSLEVELFKRKSQDSIWTIGKPYSKTYDDYNEIKNNEDLRIENLRIRDPISNEFQNCKKESEIQLQGECSPSSQNILGNEIIDKTENLEHVKMKSFKIEKSLDDASRNDNPQSDPGNASNNLSTNQNEDSQWSKQIPPKSSPNPRDFFFENRNIESHEKTGSSRTPLDLSFSNKNEDLYNESTKISQALSTNQMAATQCEINPITKNLSTPKQTLSLNEVTNNSDDRINISKELGKIKEQNDPEIRNFLRMILILGNKHGTTVYEGHSLSCNEISHENLQVKSSKRKKNLRNLENNFSLLGSKISA